MSSIRVSLILGAGLIAGLSLVNPVQAATSKPLPVPPASFLKYRVNSVGELLAQVRSDRTVRLRYAHLFNISENKVVDYMSKNLVESYIPATGKYSVYCVARDGHMFAIKQQFHSGLRVFALRNGQPVMKWACGNPLTKNLPAPPQTPTMLSKVLRHPVDQQTPTEVAMNFTDTTPTETPEVAVSPQDEVLGEIPQTTSHVVLAPVEQVQGSVEQLVFSSSSTRVPILPFVPLVGLIPRTGSGSLSGIVSEGGAGSTSGGGTRGGNGGPVGPNAAVPEANPALTVMLGLLPLGGLAFASRRRRNAVSIEETTQK